MKDTENSALIGDLMKQLVEERSRLKQAEDLLEEHQASLHSLAIGLGYRRSGYSPTNRNAVRLINSQDGKFLNVKGADHREFSVPLDLLKTVYENLISLSETRLDIRKLEVSLRKIDPRLVD